MCLESGWEEKIPNNTEQIGYKVFDVDNDNDNDNNSIITGEFMNAKPLPMNKWLDEVDYRVPGEEMPPEGFGFHVFVDYDCADAWAAGWQTIIRVKYKHVIASGSTTKYYPTHVAKYIKLVEEV